MKTERTEKLAGTAPYAPGWDRTEVSRGVAIATTLVFLLGLLVVPLTDGLLGAWNAPAAVAISSCGAIVEALRGNTTVWPRLVSANRAALAGIKRFEKSLEDSSPLAASVRPPLLDLLLRHGGAGSEEAYVGKDGWLFYRPDVDALAMRPTGRGGAARGVARLAADLAARGIRLVVVPVPGKAAIHPEKLSSSHGEFSRPLEPCIMKKFSDDVRSEWINESGRTGVDAASAPIVFDPVPLLGERKAVSNEAQFLRTDSHWSPQAMEAVASALAPMVAGVAGAAGPAATLTDRPESVEATGDTALMHDLPGSSPLLAKERVTIRRVSGPDGGVWRADHSSPVLLLGDSYANIFSSADLGWGNSAGLAEHLSQRLGFSIDRLARNDAGARSAREMLRTEALKDPGWLEGKKVVVWEMAVREFVNGDWSDIRIEGRPADRLGFFVVPPGQPVEVLATIASVGPLPRPGESPYADYLTAVHLADLRDAATGARLAGDALVYVFTMRERKVLSSADLAPGQSIKAKLSNYAGKSDMLDAVNRGELDDVELMLETPNFAEWITPSER